MVRHVFSFNDSISNLPFVSLQLCLVFRVLECILLRIADDLPQFKLVSQHVVRRILAGHLGTVYFLLSAGHKSNQIKAALKLLTAMVMQGEGPAREVQAQFNFAHSTLPQLLKRRDTKVWTLPVCPPWKENIFVDQFARLAAVSC